jgi:hypothetical protein
MSQKPGTKCDIVKCTRLHASVSYASSYVLFFQTILYRWFGCHQG